MFESAVDGSSRLAGQVGVLGCLPPVLAGAGPAYAAALVDVVAEPEGVAAFVFGEAVVALVAGVGVVRGDRGLDRWPPRVDGGCPAVDLG